MVESRYRSAIVVGKFLPPHVGHHALIRYAESLGDRVVVVLVDGDGELPRADRRALWLQAIHPDVDVLVAADLCRHGIDPCILECSDRWAEWVRNTLPTQFEVVVSSEVYGSTFADRLGAVHAPFDPMRLSWPVSGTSVRADLVGQWFNLHPIVRAGLFRRVVILGAESTGTTTLARAISHAIGAPITLEAGRIASWALASTAGGWENAKWSIENFRRVLIDQRRLEADAAHQGAGLNQGEFGPWVVCDTDALATVAWWERYLDESSDEAMHFANVDLADIYLVTDPNDVAFVQDGIRDGEHVRFVMHERFCELAEASGRPWMIVSGGEKERLATALKIIEEYEERFPRFASAGVLEP